MNTGEIQYFYSNKGFISCPACFPIVSLEVYAIYRGRGSDRYCKAGHRFHTHEVKDGEEVYTVFATLPSIKEGDKRTKADKEKYPDDRYYLPPHFLCDYCPPPREMKTVPGDCVGKDGITFCSACESGRCRKFSEWVEEQKPAKPFDKTQCKKI